MRAVASLDRRPHDRLLLPRADGIPGVDASLTEEADPTRARRQKDQSARKMHGAAGAADEWLSVSDRARQEHAASSRVASG